DDLGRSRARIVLAGHGEGIGAGRHDSKKIPLLDIQLTVACQPVAAFANRAHDVVVRRLSVAATGGYGFDAVPCAIEGGADQVVHGRVHDGEVLGFAMLQVLHLGQQHAGVAHQRTPGLEHDFKVVQAVCLQNLEDIVQQGRGRQRRFIGISYAYSCAQIKMLEMYAVLSQGLDELDELVQGVQVGADLGDLRAEVAVDPDDFQAGQRLSTLVDGQRVTDGDAELVVLEPGGYIRMGLGVDVGVHTQRYRGRFSSCFGHG